jgi:hypothetical protein
MALTQLRVPLNSDLRIDLYLISDGTVVIVPGFGFTQIFDHFVGGVSGTFDEHGFSLEDKWEKVDYDYHTPYPYKLRPVLKEWLMQQELQMPEH